MSVNKAILIGRLGKDPELRFTASQKPVASMSLATTKVWYNDANVRQEKTEWHNIVIWGKQAESAQKYLKKGSQAYVEGELQTRKWKTKEGSERYTTEVVASDIRYLGQGSGTEQTTKRSGEGITPPAIHAFQDDLTDSDVPF